MATLEEIQARMAALRVEEKDLMEASEKARAAKRDATKRKWRFTFTPRKEPRGYDKLWDPAVMWLDLMGEVLNFEECIAAGHREEDVKGYKGMAYLYNTATNKIIMPSGGGHIFVSLDPWHFVDKTKKEEALADAQRVVSELDTFIKTHPEGGDVTDVILSQRHFGWR